MDGYYAWMIVATCPRPHDDHTRARPVLRRHDALQVRPQHDDDVVRRHGGRRHRVRAVGMVDVLRARRAPRRPVLQPVQPVRAEGRRVGLLHRRLLPADLRLDHRRADLRRHRRPREAVVVDRVPAAVGHPLLLPPGAHGLGRRLDLAAPGGPGLRGRHRRAHQRRCGRRRPRAHHRQARRLRPRPDEAAQPHPHDDRCRPAVVRLVRLQRRFDRLRCR